MKKSSSVPRKIVFLKSLLLKTKNSHIHGDKNSVISNPQLLETKKNQIESSRSSKKPPIRMSSKFTFSQSTRISPNSSSVPQLSKSQKPNPYESKPFHFKMLKNFVRSKKNVKTEDNKFTNSLEKPQKRYSIKEIVTQVESNIYDFSDKGLRKKDIMIKHDEIHQAHLKQTLQTLKIIKGLRKPSLSQLKNKFIKLPSLQANKKTLIFDLDETLVHCVDFRNSDVKIDINFEKGQKLKVINNKIGLNIRPFAIECLKEAKKMFEVIIFTASHKCYADAVLDYLDPEKKYIDYRFYRENCVIVDGFHIKDLRVFENREISNIIIVDNSVLSFAFHIDNGIPIIPWHNDKHDEELFKLIDYLKVLEQSNNIQDTNHKVFKLKTFQKSFLSN